MRNNDNNYRDKDLKRAFSSLRRVEAPQRAVRNLYRRLEEERAKVKHQMPGIWSFFKHRREILVAVLATLLFAVPLTYVFTRKFALQEPLQQTYVVRFIYEDEDAKRVCLIGDFNNWQKNEIVMHKVEDSSVWTVEIPLNEGLYKYVFLINDERIVCDPLSRLKVEDSFGNESSLIVLASEKEKGSRS